jgi:hypothetical protein
MLEENAMKIQEIGFLAEISRFQARKNKGFSLYSESVVNKSETRRAVFDCGLCYLRLINSDQIVSCEPGNHLFHITCFNK